MPGWSVRSCEKPRRTRWQSKTPKDKRDPQVSWIMRIRCSESTGWNGTEWNGRIRRKERYKNGTDWTNGVEDQTERDGRGRGGIRNRRANGMSSSEDGADGSGASEGSGRTETAAVAGSGWAWGHTLRAQWDSVLWKYGSLEARLVESRSVKASSAYLEKEREPGAQRPQARTASRSAPSLRRKAVPPRRNPWDVGRRRSEALRAGPTAEGRCWRSQYERTAQRSSVVGALDLVGIQEPSVDDGICRSLWAQCTAQKFEM